MEQRRPGLINAALVLVVLLLLMCGCASIIHGPRQRVSISSTPEGAHISVDGKHIGTTPLTAKIRRKGPNVLQFSSEGYLSETIHVESSYEVYWLAVNSIWLYGWPLGVLFDLAAGSPYVLDRDNFHLRLTRKKPNSFFQTMEPSWSVIEIRNGVSDEDAWSKVRDILIRKFDLEVIERNDGYLRTGWLYTWTGEYRSDYRVRITAKYQFSEKKVELKTEAQYGQGGQWNQGYDTGLLSLIKSDIMGAIGKVTR